MPPSFPRGEIATTRDGRDITRGYVDALPWLPPTDSVLRMRGGGDYRIYEEILRDEQVAATLQQRRLALISREWEVLPGADDARSRAAADFIREVLEALNFDDLTAKMHYGIFYGFAVAECIWTTDGRFLVPEAIKVKKQRRFGFTPSGELRLRTLDRPDGLPLPDRKFWIFQVGDDNDDNPYGLGLAHWLYWPVYFKRGGVRMWATFLDKFAMPTAVGRYGPQHTPDERQALLEALEAIQTDSGIILPEGMAIELLEAMRTGTSSYEPFYNRMNEAIAKVVLGQVMTSEQVGGQYKAEVQMQVRQELVKADADLINSSFNRTVVRWLTEWNFPGATPPQIWRRITDEEDPEKLAEVRLKYYQMGYRPTLQQVIEDVGGEWIDMQSLSGLPSEQEAGFAEPPEEEAAEPPLSLGEQLQREARPWLGQWIERVRELMNEVADMQELADRLAELLPALSTEEIAALVTEALVTGELAGRYEVLRETGRV